MEAGGIPWGILVLTGVASKAAGVVMVGQQWCPVPPCVSAAADILDRCRGRQTKVQFAANFSLLEAACHAGWFPGSSGRCGGQYEVGPARSDGLGG